MDWDGWLRSSECLEVVRKCSASLIKNSRDRYTIEQCMKLDRWEQTDKEKAEKEKSSDEYLIESLSSDLWLFLQGFDPTVDLIELILSRELSSTAYYISRSFLQELKGKRRTKSISHRHHYYRAVRTVLQKKSKKIDLLKYRVIDGNAFFSFSDSVLTEVASKNLLDQQKYGQWYYPTEYIDQDKIIKEKLKPGKIYDSDVICDLAECFFQESIKKENLGSEYFLSIWSFVDYVFSHVHVRDVQIDNMFSSDEDDDVEDIVEISRDEHGEDFLDSITRQEIEAKAHKLLRGWPLERKRAFLLRYRDDLTYAEIGNKGVDSPQYQINLANESIKAVWYDDLVGTGPISVVDELGYKYFIGCLFKFCV